MVKKIFRSTLAAVLAVLLAAFILLIGFLYEYFSSLQESELDVLLGTLADAVEYGGAELLDSVVPEGRRVTWIDADGDVIYDSEVDAEMMENHSDREEFIDAVNTGTGQVTRYSSTLTERTTYRAVLLSDGTVLRISMSSVTVLTLTLGMCQPILICIVAAFALSAFIAHKLSVKIVGPINGLDLDRPLENDVYEELSPLLLRINRQNDEISERMEELRERDAELRDIMSNMRESLVLIGDDGKIVSINPAACALFDAGSDSVGKHFITVCRRLDVKAAIEKARAEGHSEMRLEKGESTWQLEISRTGDELDVGSGVVLIAFDVTEQLSAENMRREFTANVSHELKTPLQSIMGSAELLENGLVKKEDAPRFIGHIRRESERLVLLIDDIIRLSQLDEDAEFVYENVDIYELAGEEVEAVASIAEKHGITVTLEGTSTVIYGVKRLFHEILYNLCDNAVKYNVDGGSVRVMVGEENGHKYITVKDTGIGIPKEHIPRIFERFYRVDKSRSKSTGGTGLGLSIVKHAVMYMKGTISVKSEVGAGTEIKVVI